MNSPFEYVGIKTIRVYLSHLDELRDIGGLETLQVVPVEAEAQRTHELHQPLRLGLLVLLLLLHRGGPFLSINNELGLTIAGTL